MESVKGFIQWCVENKENLIIFLVALGGLVESLNALFPTPNKDSFLEKLGRLISKLTAKLPSVQKKLPEDNK